MQDLTAIAQNLHNIAAAFKDGGLFFLIGVGLFFAYKAIVAITKHQRKATQEVNISLPPASGHNNPGTNGSGKVCPLHSGVEAQIESLEGFRKENRVDHAKMFDQINDLAIVIAKK